jgi:hypothetical protein
VTLSWPNYGLCRYSLNPPIRKVVRTSYKKSGVAPAFLSVCYALFLHVVEYVMPFEDRRAVQLVLDAQKLVVLGDAVGAAE